MAAAPPDLYWVIINTTITIKQLWAGIPAKFQRELTAQEIANMKATAIENFEVRHTHKHTHAGICVCVDIHNWTPLDYDWTCETRVVSRACVLCVFVRTPKMATIHKDETSKDYKTVALDLDDWEDAQERSDDYWPRCVCLVCVYAVRTYVRVHVCLYVCGWVA
jgi:hypothetical protein